MTREAKRSGKGTTGETPAVRGLASTRRVRQPEMAWLGKHRKEMEELYPGQWLAVKGNKLVAHGDNLADVLREATEKGVDDPVLSGVKSKDWQNVLIVR